VQWHYDQWVSEQNNPVKNNENQEYNDNVESNDNDEDQN
jgi:hypothetical protein